MFSLVCEGSRGFLGRRGGVGGPREVLRDVNPKNLVLLALSTAAPSSVRDAVDVLS